VKLQRDEWRSLCAKFTKSSRVDAWFDEIVRRYNEPQRSYHNEEHIAHCLAEFHRVAHLAQHGTEVELALWLHDVVYDPRRGDNEEESAAFTRSVCEQAGVDDQFKGRVADLILATKHNAPAATKDAHLVVDIDLAILGEDEPRFWRYEAQIREEYAFVPEELFRTKRAEILERFLERERIYTTDEFFGRYETVARQNLKESIAALRSQL
jgi:predicted metal-dependent HD superfamily phosphohydrolase